MEEEGTKTCPNCKHEIPARNYDIHTVHCARNIKVCHVCKEPVLLSELDVHHDKLHKLLPCKECGEKICGTDLEDHVRDSCANTMKSCRFCELDLRRGELPGHERYCGARTEQCSDCGEWVMHKYKQLHIESNHGFLRLDDDPEPIKKSNIVKPLSNLTNGSIGSKIVNMEAGKIKNTNLNCMQREFGLSNLNQRRPNVSPGPSTSNLRDSPMMEDELISPISSNGAIPRIKRTNDQTQVNRTREMPDKVSKNLWSSRGAVKKRPAPPPPGPSNIIAERAEHRREQEERTRAKQTARNLAQGLPPVLNPLEMDALQNREVGERSYRKVPCQNSSNINILGRGAIDQAELEKQRERFKNFVPMTPEEFGERFRTLQLRNERNDLTGDRFSQIKSSLRELRRGLNEVTAPYNQNSVPEVNFSAREQEADSQEEAGAVASAVVDDDVALPCEFCAQLVPMYDLVVHQTGCRPDLTQLKPTEPSRSAAVTAGGDDVTGGDVTGAPQPVIPCEFCTRSLPVELISEHQVRCERESRLLFPD